MEADASVNIGLSLEAKTRGYVISILVLASLLRPLIVEAYASLANNKS